MALDGQVNIDIDPITGENIEGWDVVQASIERLILTHFGQRPLREYIGSVAPAALGRNITEDTVMLIWLGISMVIDLFEPRYRIIKFEPVEVRRDGTLRLRIDGEYVPHAQLGDSSQRVRRAFNMTI